MESLLFHPPRYTAFVMRKASMIRATLEFHQVDAGYREAGLSELDGQGTEIGALQQTALLRTIDTFLEGAAARAARRA